MKPVSRRGFCIEQDGERHRWQAECRVGQFNLDGRPQPLPCPAGAVIRNLPDRIAVLILRMPAGVVVRVEQESGVEQRLRHLIAKLAKRAAEAVAADGCCRPRHDLEIHILRHAPDDAVRPRESGAAAEEGDRRERRRSSSRKLSSLKPQLPS
jgi:hypothetical protein